MLRTFDKHDWDAFAGAEPLSDGRLPMIGEYGATATIILSGTWVTDKGMRVRHNAVEIMYPESAWIRTYNVADAPLAQAIAEDILRLGPEEFLQTAVGKLFQRWAP